MSKKKVADFVVNESWSSLPVTEVWTITVRGNVAHVYGWKSDADGFLGPFTAEVLIPKDGGQMILVADAYESRQEAMNAARQVLDMLPTRTLKDHWESQNATIGDFLADAAHGEPKA